MRIERIVANLTVPNLEQVVDEHRAATGLDVLMDHGWIVTLGDHDGGNQISLMTTDLTGPTNPAVSIFVDDIDQAHSRVQSAGLEMVYPMTEEPWGIRRFFYRDSAGNVINAGTHS